MSVFRSFGYDVADSLTFKKVYCSHCRAWVEVSFFDDVEFDIDGFCPDCGFETMCEPNEDDIPSSGKCKVCVFNNVEECMLQELEFEDKKFEGCEK